VLLNPYTAQSHDVNPAYPENYNEVEEGSAAY